MPYLFAIKSSYRIIEYPTYRQSRRFCLHSSEYSSKWHWLAFFLNKEAKAQLYYKDIMSKHFQKWMKNDGSSRCGTQDTARKDTCMELLEFMGTAMAKRPLHSMRKKVRMRPYNITARSWPAQRKEALLAAVYEL